MYDSILWNSYLIMIVRHGTTMLSFHSLLPQRRTLLFAEGRSNAEIVFTS